MDVNVTLDDFHEEAYLCANPDVADAVKRGDFKSGLDHFMAYGADEKRRGRLPRERLTSLKKEKVQRIKPLLRADLTYATDELVLDFLTDDLREQYRLVDTERVSSNDYDGDALALIEKHCSGLVLDCGAGKRPVYFSNVINLEVVPYDTTDVLAAGQCLPFKSESIDAVISSAVLEHVSDPFLCAREIVRVLKPGGDLMCAVPFLQPLHAYPNHYYNMTHAGLRNLFPGLEIHKQTVPRSTLPIWALTWILRSWTEGLSGEALDEFLNQRVADLLEEPTEYFGRAFVTGLSEEKNFELACATVLFATKPR